MNTRITIAIAALAGLLGCSTPETAQTTQSVTPLPPLPDLAPGDELMRPQVCKLGTSCLAMDPRPFEPCLLSTKHCSDKAAEPLLVAATPSIIPAPQAVVSR
ncbi:MAG TPA: hypothetical protein VNM71_12165 [Steroidobacteraceae bacterium]|jgi:hypothetical protein|nr:hypothetical protein [Steroidobacteraceae bacterium]